MKEPRSNFRAAEEEYFRKQDAELVQRLKEEKAEKERRHSEIGHKGHCSSCGHDTTVIDGKIDLGPSEKRGIEAWIGAHVCLQCHQVSLPFATLQKLLFNKEARLMCQDIHDHVLSHPERGSDHDPVTGKGGKGRRSA